MSKWNLGEIFESEKAWEVALESLRKDLTKLDGFEGKLDNLSKFEEFHKICDTYILDFYKVYVYAKLAFDLNLKDNKLNSNSQKVMSVINEYDAKIAFSNPEIISLGQDKVESFCNKSDYIKQHAYGFKKLFKGQSHVLTDQGEKLISNFSKVAHLSPLYSALAVSDRVNKEVVLSTGKKVLVTQSSFTSLLNETELQADRKLIFEGLFSHYKEHKNTFAAIYKQILESGYAMAKSRNYKTTLESKLFNNNIPVSVVENLIDVAKSNNEGVIKYRNLKKEFFKLDNFYTYDNQLKFTKDNTKYSYEDGKDLFFKALEGFDEEYVAKQKEALSNGFVDVLPTDGKRTGAYSMGVHGIHPFILLNHNETLRSVFTTVHEAGHSAHSLFSCENEPMQTSGYTIFVAEIASTFNEHLLLDYLVKNSTSKEQKVALLQNSIDDLMGTFFRQTEFASFEVEAHKLVESGKPINSDVLSNIIIENSKHFQGIDLTEQEMADLIWAYIPHFYNSPFYVYQYATAYSASLKFYEDVKNNKTDAMKNYIQLLKSGGNDYPVDQVKKAGVDLTTKEPFMAVINRLNYLVDELEKAIKE